MADAGERLVAPIGQSCDAWGMTDKPLIYWSEDLREEIGAALITAPNAPTGYINLSTGPDMAQHRTLRPTGSGHGHGRDPAWPRARAAEHRRAEGPRAMISSSGRSG
jgi:hypothetical protein